MYLFAPGNRSDPENLQYLQPPDPPDQYLMAEWHFYAAGPSQTNPKKLWTVGTEKEKQLIIHKVNTAIKWQKKTGIYSWVGAWMPGNYNDGNTYSVEEQIKFALFIKKTLDDCSIPFSINSDSHFYSNGEWIESMRPLLTAVFQ